MHFNNINGPSNYSDHTLPPEANRETPVEVKVALTNLNKDRPAAAKRRAPTKVRELKGFNKEAVNETKKQEVTVEEAPKTLSSVKGKLNMAAFANIHKAIGAGSAPAKPKNAVQQPVEEIEAKKIGEEKENIPPQKLKEESNEILPTSPPEARDDTSSDLFDEVKSSTSNFEYVSIFKYALSQQLDFHSRFEDLASMERYSRDEAMNAVIDQELYGSPKHVFDMAKGYQMMTEGPDPLENFGDDFSRIEKGYQSDGCVIS
jgi:hypothetical protein